MDNGNAGNERRTRSGRKISGAGYKRAREREEDLEEEVVVKRNKMTKDKDLDPQLESLKAFFSDELEKKLKTNREEIVAVNQASLLKLTNRIDATQSDLQQHKELMQAELKKVHEALGSAKANASPGATYAEAAGCFSGQAGAAASNSHSSELLLNFCKSRRSARVAPIGGSANHEIWAGLQRFFNQMMRVPSSEMNEKDIVEARRVKVGRGKKENNEVLVRFVDVETRDRFASYAKNLGEFIQDGKPTATFRHDIPVHLTGAHRTLMQYGHFMKNKYGHEFKKNIRFDDINHSFCIDMLIPGQHKWETVSYLRALEDCKTRTMQVEQQRGSALSSQLELTSVDGPRDILRPPSAGLLASIGAGVSGVNRRTAATHDEEDPEPMQDTVWGRNK